jgi:chromosomal replication initiation ATPase DnaA
MSAYPKPDLIWENCLQQLQEDLPPQHFNMWIRPLQFGELQGNWLLYAPNQFVKDWIDIEYLLRIQEVLSAVIGKPATISVVVGTKPKQEINASSVVSEKAITTSEEKAKASGMFSSSFSNSVNFSPITPSNTCGWSAGIIISVSPTAASTRGI